MIKRIKRLWELTKKDPKVIEKLESLSPEQVSALPNEGDGKTMFFAEGTESDYKEFEKEQSGLDKWYKRIGL